MSTLMTFVPPGRFTAVPAVMTSRSPGATSPDSRAASIERAQRSSTSVVSGMSSGVTPHSSAMCRSDSILCVSARIARWGRRRATAEAVRPVNVGTRIAFAESASATSQAAFDIAWSIVGASLACGVSWR